VARGQKDIFWPREKVRMRMVIGAFWCTNYHRMESWKALRICTAIAGNWLYVTAFLGIEVLQAFIQLTLLKSSMPVCSNSAQNKPKKKTLESAYN
jgi:hypothetical protein